MNWISVKDSLPSLHEDVLVFVEGISYNSGPYKSIDISNLTELYGEGFKVEGIEWNCTMSCKEVVTHWMPLPEPPIR